MINLQIPGMPTAMPDSVPDRGQELAMLKSLPFDELMDRIVHSMVEFAINLAIAIVVFYVGRLIITKLYKVVSGVFARRSIDRSLAVFVLSMVRIVLYFILIVTVIGILGINTTSFIAIFASAGVAVGMALSGNLSNFAGGLIILLFKPYKVGDYIEAQGVGGTVKEIQMFHTVLGTPDNKIIYIPNGSLSSGVVTNFSNQTTRRVDWTFGVEYGSDYEKVKQVIESVLAKDSRILSEPAAPFIALTALADSSVNVVVRVWVNSSDYWGVYFDINKNIYATFNEVGIDFPFPQLTVHQAKD